MDEVVTQLGEAPGERLEWSQPRNLPGVSMLLADNCARRWRVFHETYSVCTGIAIRKPAPWKYRGSLHLQPANGLSLMEPGEMHENTEITAPASFRVLMIQPKLVHDAAEHLGMRGGRHLKIAQLHGGPIHREFLALHRALERAATRLECQARFDACIRLVLEHCTEEGLRAPAQAHGATVQRARDYIHERFAESIGLDELVAATGGISRFHLVRAFSARFGAPPHAYQIGLRISRARALLAAGMQLAHVAAALGFADQSHFTRHFRRAVGVTPAAYRRRVALSATSVPVPGDAGR